jgi:hypothetical protein
MKSRSVIVTLLDAHSVPSLRQYSVCGSLDELGTIPRDHVLPVDERLASFLISNQQLTS